MSVYLRLPYCEQRINNHIEQLMLDAKTGDGERSLGVFELGISPVTQIGRF